MRVLISCQASKPTPSIELFPTAPPVPTEATMSRSPEMLVIATGGLSAEVTNNPYTVTFKSHKRTLTFAGPKHQAVVDVPHQWTLNSASEYSCLTTDRSSNPTPGSPPKFVRYMLSELNLSPGENIYGLGEQFGAFVKNGMLSQLFWRRARLIHDSLVLRAIHQCMESRRWHV
jgi:alpha-glucosidase (family GH31 glycosyl hydrolase)